MPQTELLLTAGYAGHDSESFLGILRQHEVEVVVDIRQNPVSRKKGFSRSKLSAFLAANHVEYIHVSELGVPVHLRRRLNSGEEVLSAYLEAFRVYLSNCGGALDRLNDLASTKRCCLMCVERLHSQCHRSIVAEAVKARKWP